MRPALKTLAWIATAVVTLAVIGAFGAYVITAFG